MSKPELSNHDYPYHDFKSYAAASVPASYNVGHDNREAKGDQNKPFVSKDTLIYSDGTVVLHFNHTENVAITIPPTLVLTFESNIHSVHIDSITADKTLYMYFEGVLPEEARRPE